MSYYGFVIKTKEFTFTGMFDKPQDNPIMLGLVPHLNLIMGLKEFKLIDGKTDIPEAMGFTQGKDIDTKKYLDNALKASSDIYSGPLSDYVARLGSLPCGRYKTTTGIKVTIKEWNGKHLLGELEEDANPFVKGQEVYFNSEGNLTDCPVALLEAVGHLEKRRRGDEEW